MADVSTISASVVIEKNKVFSGLVDQDFRYPSISTTKNYKRGQESHLLLPPLNE